MKRKEVIEAKARELRIKHDLPVEDIMPLCEMANRVAETLTDGDENKLLADLRQKLNTSEVERIECQKKLLITEATHRSG